MKAKLSSSKNSPGNTKPIYNYLYLALLRQEKGPFKPLTSGKIFLFGILTLSNTISPVVEALNDSFPLITFADNPFIPFSNMNPLISPFSSFAHTTNTSAIGELVIQVLDPLRTY